MDKKIKIVLAAAAVLGVLSGCAITGNAADVIIAGTAGSQEETGGPGAAVGETADSGTEVSSEENSGSSTLIAYFSRAGENYSVGVIEKGNTEIIAEMIAEQAGGDLFRIERATAYPESYEECTDEAQQEQNDAARPELKSDLESIEQYDVIFIGYPIWWGDMPMPVYTFLESHDFSGKTVIPFCTNEGSGLASTVSHVENVTGAEIKQGLAIRGSVAQNSREEAERAVTDWLSEVLE